MNSIAKCQNYPHGGGLRSVTNLYLHSFAFFVELHWPLQVHVVIDRCQVVPGFVGLETAKTIFFKESKNNEFYADLSDTFVTFTSCLSSLV